MKFTIYDEQTREIRRTIKCPADEIAAQLAAGEAYMEGAYPREKYELDEEGLPVELPERDPRRKRQAARDPNLAFKLMRAVRRDLKAAGIDPVNIDRLMRGE